MENASWDTLKNMKKNSLMRQIKDKHFMKTLDKFENEKKSHSKVKLRCRMTEAKIDLRGMYDNLDCGACRIEEETHHHIIKCK